MLRERPVNRSGSMPRVQFQMSESTLYSLSQIPRDPGFVFPSPTINPDGGGIQSPEWVSDLLTDEQKKIRNAAVIDVVGTKPGEITEPGTSLLFRSGQRVVAKPTALLLRFSSRMIPRSSCDRSAAPNSP
jgi:hypothetical protein